MEVFVNAPNALLPLLTLLLLALLLPSGVRAEEPVQRADEPVQRADEPVQRADDIVVEEEVLRPAEIFEDTPVETEILTQEDLRTLPAQNAAQAVEKLPGIRTQQRVQGEEAAVSIEGMPPTYTKILVDDQRYTGEIGGVSDLRDIPLENVERIEIIRGTQGLRYGSEAAGGVVNLIRRDPPESGVRLDGRAGAGSHDNIQGAGTAGYGFGDVGVSLSFDHDEIGGFDRPDDVGDAVLVGGNSDSRRLSRDVNGDVLWRPSSTFKLRGRGGWRQLDEDFVFDEADESGNLEGETDTERWIGTAEAEWFVGERTRLTGAVTYYRNFFDSDVGRAFSIDEDEVKLDTAAELFFETGPVNHALTFGVDGRHDRLRLDEGPLPAGVDNSALQAGDLRESLSTLGLFAIGESELTDWFAVEYGARVQIHSEFATRLLPHGALLFKPHRTLRLRLGAGRNYRTPSLRDLYQPPVPQLGGAYFLAGNPTLSTESSVSYRASVEYNPWSWLSFSTVGFYNDIDDHIRSVFVGSVPIGFQTIFEAVPPDRPGLALICEVTGNFFPECATLGDVEVAPILSPIERPLYRKTNLDAVITRGFEVRLQMRPKSWIEFQAGYTYLDTEVVDSNLIDVEELPNEAPHVVDATLSLTAPWTETVLVGRMRWRDGALVERSGTGLLSFTSLDRADPSTVVDLRLTQPIPERFRFGASRVEIYADVLNVLDERVVDSYVVRGRSFFIGVRAGFN